MRMRAQELELDTGQGCPVFGGGGDLRHREGRA